MPFNMMMTMMEILIFRLNRFHSQEEFLNLQYQVKKAAGSDPVEVEADTDW